MTKPRRVLRVAATAAVGVAVWAAGARGDVVTPELSQGQTNRLSILHDYGLDALGDSSGDGGGVAGHGGGYLGEVPVIGTPGQGAAAAILSKLSDRFTFLQGIQSTDPAGTARSYDVSLGYASGYDSNPQARPSPRDGSFFGGDLTAGYHLTGGDRDPVVGTPFRADLAYTVLGAFYSGPRADADVVQQGLSGSFRQSLADNRLALTGALNDQFTMEHGAAFLDTVDAAAGAEGFVLPQLSLEGAYDYTHLQYFFRPAAVAEKPTADRHTLDARLHLYTIGQVRGADRVEERDDLTRFVQAALRRATLGYAHVWNFPDQQTGTDYRYQSDRVYVGLEGLTLPPEVRLFGQPIAQGTAGSVLYSHEFQSFGFVNSETFASPHARRDNLDVLTLRSNTRILDFANRAGLLATFLQLDLIHDGSNVPTRHFNELVVSSGLTYQY